MESQRTIITVYVIFASMLFILCIWQMEIAMFNIVHNYPFGLFLGYLILDNWFAWEFFAFLLFFLWISVVLVLVGVILNYGKNYN
jgi:hypothetical protein